jgi:hypothetical protein
LVSHGDLVIKRRGLVFLLRPCNQEERDTNTLLLITRSP